MKRKKSRKFSTGPIFVSPDGGETVYEQFANGTKKLVSKSRLALDIEQGEEEQEMIGPVAIELRRKYPSLKKAWEQYRTVWHLINEKD